MFVKPNTFSRCIYVKYFFILHQEDGRRKRIQELVRSIARTKKQKKQKLIGKDTHMENPKKVNRITFLFYFTVNSACNNIRFELL